MGDTIRAIGELVDRHGFGIAVGIVLLGLLVAIMTVHIMMLKKWADSNVSLATASEARTQNIERQFSTVLVQNMNLQNSLLGATGKQNEKLDQLIEAAKSAAERVAEEKEVFSEQTGLLKEIRDDSKKTADLLGSDPTKLCQLEGMLKSRFPDVSPEQIQLLLKYFLKKAEEVEAKGG